MAREFHPYEAGSDVIQVWNLFSKRITSYPDNVRAVFAALLHKSAGKILKIVSHLRTRAIMRSVERLPTNILLIVQKAQPDRGTQIPSWVPELPGSKVPMPLSSSRWDTLKHVAGGFTVNLSKVDLTTTRATICLANLIRASQSLSDNGQSMGTFSIQVDQLCFTRVFSIMMEQTNPTSKTAS